MDILMSFVDLIPVGLFLAAAIILQRCLYNKMSKGAFAVFSAGTIFVFVAGFSKALYKILKFTGICRWEALANGFFFMETVGFCLVAAAMIAALFFKQGENKMYVSLLPLLFLAEEAMPEFDGKMIFVVFMCLGVLIMDLSFGSIAVRMHKPAIVILLVVAFIFTLAMGYLSTKAELSDWYKEIVNSIGQGAFFASALLFKKSGLAEENAPVSFRK